MKTKKQSVNDTEVLDRIDCLNRSLANLRSDIAEIVYDAIAQTLKECEKSKKYIEVGYR